MNDKFLWIEKYRPKRVADTVLPDRIKSYFQDLADKKTVNNMTLTGPPGSGKTSVARALCDELGIDYLLINASEQGNIDTIRTTVRQFASTMSFSDGLKCIILDEADYITPNAQGALRGSIEEFANNCRFILTANFENRIIEPLKSRCPVVNFNFTKEEKKKLIVEFDGRVKSILNENGIQYDKTDLAQVLVKNFPDFRRTLNLLQRFCFTGSLEVTTATGIGEEELNRLFLILKDKKFNEMRKWVVDNMDNDGAMIRRELYNRCHNFLHPNAIPQLILHCNKYDYQESFVMDKEINMVAFFIEVMADCQWA